MKTLKWFRMVFLVKGILLVLLAIVHFVATFALNHNEGNEPVPIYFYHNFQIWFLATGMFILFLGVLDLLLYSELKYKLYGIWKVAFITALFTVLLGGTGTFYFREGPPILIFILGLIAMGPVWIVREDYKL